GHCHGVLLVDAGVGDVLDGVVGDGGRDGRGPRVVGDEVHAIAAQEIVGGLVDRRVGDGDGERRVIVSDTADAGAARVRGAQADHDDVYLAVVVQVDVQTGIVGVAHVVVAHRGVQVTVV